VSAGGFEVPAAQANDPVFIVGCERSGTTMLRLMLDSHPSLAIPNESHFIVSLYPAGWLAARRSPVQTLERVLEDESFARWELDPMVVRQLATVTRPSSYADVIRTVFAAYAAREGKPRWGDKSPTYLARIPLLAELFPGAQFIHIIRDGREVAASLASQAWGPPTAIAGAAMWKTRVREGRRAGSRLPPGRYMEVRVEQLVDEPEQVLRTICGFLHEEFAPGMLDYHRTRGEQIRSIKRGYPITDHRHLSLPPTRGLRDWRAGLTATDQLTVEAAAQPLLQELGYAARDSSLRASLRALADRLRWLPANVLHACRSSVRRFRAELSWQYRYARARSAAQLADWPEQQASQSG
jgi:hypothetical protein